MRLGSRPASNAIWPIPTGYLLTADSQGIVNGYVKLPLIIAYCAQYLYNMWVCYWRFMTIVAWAPLTLTPHSAQNSEFCIFVSTFNFQPVLNKQQTTVYSIHKHLDRNEIHWPIRWTQKTPQIIQIGSKINHVQNIKHQWVLSSQRSRKHQTIRNNLPSEKKRISYLLTTRNKLKPHPSIATLSPERTRPCPQF